MFIMRLTLTRPHRRSYVFDGKPPTMKGGELAKRKDKREDAEAALEKAKEVRERFFPVLFIWFQRVLFAFPISQISIYVFFCRPDARIWSVCQLTCSAFPPMYVFFRPRLAIKRRSRS